MKPIRTLADAGFLRGAAHITGGGITDNTPRILPAGLAARIDPSAWPVPPIFEKLRAIGGIPEADYRRTFNLGIGMILVVARRNAMRAEGLLETLREKFYRIGEVVESRRERVIYARR